MHEFIQYHFFYIESGNLIWRKNQRKIKTFISKGNTKNYLAVNLFGKIYKLHRLIYIWHNVEFFYPEIDHIDGDSFNNKIENLRACTNSQNQMNRKKSIVNTSGYKGVTIKNNGIEAAIKLNGKTIYLGRYSTLEKAAKAYDEKAKELFGEFYSK